MQHDHLILFINYVLLSLFIGMMTCFLDSPFVIMLSLGLVLPSPLMIFLVYKLGNVSLSFRTSLVMLVGIEA